MNPDELRTVTRKIFNAYQLNATLGAPMMVTSIGVVLGLQPGEQTRTAILFAVLLSVLIAPAPYLFTRETLRQAYATPDAGLRLTRLLEAPRRIELLNVFTLLCFASVYLAALVLRFDKSAASFLWSVLLIAAVTCLLWVQVRLSIETLLRPWALREFHRLEGPFTPGRSGRGPLWPRQAWFLPYAFGLFLVSTAMTLLVILERSAERMLPTLVEDLSGIPHEEIEPYLRQSLGALVEQVTFPLVMAGTYLLLSAGISAWRMARHQVEGARAVQSSLEALVSGHPQPPAWVSTDEMGDLARATSQVYAHLRTLSLALHESARELGGSAHELGQSTQHQTEVLSRQAAALQQTQVTAQELKETSAVAYHKAELVLRDTARVEQLSRQSEAVVGQSLEGLESIRQVVVEMAQRIRELDGRTRQIGHITTAVKDLADRSNMLALNAAIEAVRSGEHGKGFAVVAREIRTLAHQSLKATRGVRDLLEDIGCAIRATADITESGAVRVDGSLQQVRQFGDNLRQLSGIVRDNASSVRQISSAVTQQNAGISQLFLAVNELSGMMEQTMQRLHASEGALHGVGRVVQRVTGLVGDAHWEQR